MIDMYLVATTVSLLALTLGAVSIYKSTHTDRRIDQLFAGLDHNDDIAETLERYFTQVKSTEDKLDKIQHNYQYLSEIAATSIQKTAIVRFNPFKNTGGDQSFALSLLDNHDNGLMLTSIHSREGTRVYIKPIRYGTSDHTLSKEEQSALEAAMKAKEERKPAS